MENNRIRRLNVLVTHPEPVVAIGLAAALREQSDIQVHREVDSPSLDPADAFDVVVSDYQGALGLLGEERRHALPRSLAGARVLVVARSDREHEVRTAVESGVYGYLLVGCPIDELAAGVRELGRGSRYLCMEATQRMAESLTRPALTAREEDVLRLLARGQCNKSIARELDVAVGTVKTHMRSLMGKLDASSRTQAVGIAAERGLVDGTATGAPSSRVGWSRPVSPHPLRAMRLTVGATRGQPDPRENMSRYPPLAANGC